MKKPIFPGFTAELSLYETSRHYVKAMQNSEVLIGSRNVRPQLLAGIQELSCYLNCLRQSGPTIFGLTSCVDACFPIEPNPFNPFGNILL
jgi:hypothetical protein